VRHARGGCAVAIAECFRGDGEVLVSPIGTLPQIGAKLAKLTFEPDLLMTDGVAPLLANVLPVSGKDGPIPWSRAGCRTARCSTRSGPGRRHVMMGATQIDRFGNQNIACIGDYAKPKAQLLGMRGAPGNTINHTTSYWVPGHSDRVFVEKVDVVSGIGTTARRRSARSRRASTRSTASCRTSGVFDFATGTTACGWPRCTLEPRSRRSSAIPRSSSRSRERARDARAQRRRAAPAARGDRPGRRGQRGSARVGELMSFRIATSDGVAELVIDNPPVNALSTKAWADSRARSRGSAATTRCAAL
jgi:acyl CoA:acetate/3-ketoacid CoA transferase beta subunit